MKTWITPIQLSVKMTDTYHNSARSARQSSILPPWEGVSRDPEGEKDGNVRRRRPVAALKLLKANCCVPNKYEQRLLLNEIEHSPVRC